MKWNNLSKYGKYLVSISILIIFMVLISTIIGFFSTLRYLEGFRIVFGSVYVLFIPGFILTYIFFPQTKEFDSKDKETNAIDWIERIALSFALSIAVVPLIIFYLNLIGLKITLLNSFLSILGIILVSLIILYLKNKKRQKEL
ncbi:DUF1616 domain-containing protein [Candidatus Woesearchaeota archaeon]|nr:DUF1616 domain-containing protein [Candidatus Woesearchaeota archaeon]